MNHEHKIRRGWLKFMYWYTIVGAGGFGLGILLIPETMQTVFRWPSQDPIVFGIIGSVYAAFAILSVFGLRSPIQFTPVLLLQLSYKVVWLVFVIMPLLFTGEFPKYAILHVAIFVSYIVGDLIAIPFSAMFSKEKVSASLQFYESL